MTILHYIPAMNMKGWDSLYVSSLVRSTERVATSHVIEEKDLGTPLLDFIHHGHSKLRECNPDVVHVHASWNLRAAIFAMLARHMGFFVVVSPHEGVTQETIGQHFWKRKLPRIIAYQFRMLRKSRLVVAVSQEEHERLKRLGWKKRMILAARPSTGDGSSDELCSQIMAAYRKVIDTHYLERITESEIGFTIRCVREALRREGHFMQKSEPYEMPEGLSFRRIYLFAHDNGVTPLLLEGARRLGLPMPSQLNVDALPRFTEQQKRKTSMERSFLKFREILKKEIPEDCEIMKKEIPEATCDNIFTPQGEISLLAFANVYCAMRFNDYDEEKFMASMRRAGLEKYTAQLMNLFLELFNIEEGFMPVAPG